jgi:hypothetical protein
MVSKSTPMRVDEHSGSRAEFDDEIAAAVVRATLAGCGTGRELGAPATIS